MEHALDFYLYQQDQDNERDETAEQAMEFLFPFDEFLNADWCDHGFDSQNECPICNLDLQQDFMDRCC